MFEQWLYWQIYSTKILSVSEYTHCFLNFLLIQGIQKKINTIEAIQQERAYLLHKINMKINGANYK